MQWVISAISSIDQLLQELDGALDDIDLAVQNLANYKNPGRQVL